MGEDTIKLVALGVGGLLIGMMFLGGRSRGSRDPGIEATLESMRITSQTQLGYAQYGVESQRIQAELTAEKDRNRTSIQIGRQQSELARHDIDVKAKIDVFRIQQDSSRFYEGLRAANESERRWINFERFKLGKEISAGYRLAQLEAGTTKYVESKRAQAARAASEQGLQLAIGEQSLRQDAQTNSFIASLLQSAPGLIDIIARSGRSIYNAFSGVAGGYGGSGSYGRSSYSVTQPNPGPYVAQAGDSTMNDLASIGEYAALGATVGGPYGAVGGALAGVFDTVF